MARQSLSQHHPKVLIKRKPLQSRRSPRSSMLLRNQAINKTSKITPPINSTPRIAIIITTITITPTRRRLYNKKRRPNILRSPLGSQQGAMKTGPENLPQHKVTCNILIHVPTNFIKKTTFDYPKRRSRQRNR
ncbi:hypothetical protein V8G54_024329 [Vigna mungo]|uniref:Uncharacterized protein n=1 Tax=Vigna mungo TaxID=3915 RepID=A0AAQ3N770_VIGMU